MPTCTVDNRGRIVVPANWRRRNGIIPGTKLIVLDEEGQLVIQTRAQAVSEAQEIVRNSVQAGRSLTKDLMRERRANVAE